MAILNSNQQPIIGWRSLVVTQVVNAVDADAQAFITAAGITNLVQAAAVSTLVNDLKTYGLWTKMKALYPMVGGTATSHKFNLKDPRDLDAAYRLVFNGGGTHNSNGYLGAVNGYANTYLSPQTAGIAQNSTHISFYATQNITTINRVYLGGMASTSLRYYFYTNNFSVNESTESNHGLTTNTGLLLATRTISNSAKVYRNGNLSFSSTTNSSGNLNIPIFIMNRNLGGSPVSAEYYQGNSAFASIGDGLTDTEAANFYNSVQKFQTTLGRQIGSPIVSDTDAQAFINAAGLTDLGQANAVNTLVVDLKAAGVWTKMKALYPFVGGTATTHKWNLKDPRDLDAAFRLVFNGGWTHTSTGAKPNGTTGYADTKIIPSVNMIANINNMSMASYVRNTPKGALLGTDKQYRTVLSPNYAGTSGSTMYYPMNSTSNISRTPSPTTLGLYMNSRTDNTTVKLFINGSLYDSTTNVTDGQDTLSICISARNDVSPSYYSNSETAFASIGDGLTDSEALAFYTSVQKYQTSLSRQIGTPVLAEGQTARLLDIYGDSIGAYSLRKLRTGYVGNAIRVRRSSDNVEQDIAFDASGNLDTTSLLAFVGSGNGYVSIWYDQSGKYGPSINNYAFQNTPAYQPTIVLNGSLQMNGNKPAIYWDNNQYLLINTPATGTGIRGVINIKSVFVNIKWLTGSGASPILGNEGATAYYHEGITGEAGLILSSSFADYNVKNGSNYINGTLKTPSTFSKSTNSNILVSMVHLTNTISFSQLGNDRGFAGTYFKGYYSEIIAYSTDPTTNRTGIETNINSYYSIY